MCTQAVGLVASAMEREGISTVAVQLLRDVAEKVGPPRGLWVPFRHGHPLGEPDNPVLQHRIIDAALLLLEENSTEPPVLVDYEPAFA